VKEPPPPDAVARLRATWLADLPARGGEILAALDKLAQTPTDEAARAQARSLSHRLKGTAGAFGLLAVGGAAGEIEEALLATGPCEPAEVRALIALLSASLLREQDGRAPSLTKDGRKPRILFVGGNDALLRKLTDLARARSWEIDATLGATEALQAAAVAWPDALVLALEDPSGGEAASLVARLKSLRPEAPLPVGGFAGPIDQGHLRDAIVALLTRE